jgi:hypothetical protein
LLLRNLENQIMTANYTVSGNVFVAERPRGSLELTGGTIPGLMAGASGRRGWTLDGL